MGRLRQQWIGWVSEVSWRLPGRPAKLLAGFSQAERGSCFDMLAAVEETERRELRLKYFRHAMDESRHAGLFLERARATGRLDRVQAVVADAGYLTRQGIVGGETLFSQLGELDFLAFVHVAEREAIEQFHVYLDRSLPDPDTQATLHRILKDERFHVSYSLAALDHYQDPQRVAQALRSAQRDRYRQAWLRMSRRIGHFMGSLWLVVLYGLLVAPFAVIARLERGGWQPVPRGGAAADASPLAAARSQG
jgi:hypothetical protein